MTDQPKTAVEWAKEIHSEFHRESDRAAGIVAGAMPDEALLTLLRARLAEPLKERSLLDSHNAPLGAFSPRIDAAHQLGLISEYLARDLHIIRKIRNEFAHAPLRTTFDTPPIADWVGALEAASDYNRRHPETREAIGPAAKKWNFLGIVAWILYQFQREADETQSIKKHNPAYGYIQWEELPDEIRRRLENARS